MVARFVSVDAAASGATTIEGIEDERFVTPAGAAIAAKTALHDTYAGKGSTTLTTADSGQTWLITNTGTVDMEIISDTLGSTGVGRGYADIDMGAKVQRIGARWEWTTGATSEGTVGILIWASHITSPASVPDSICHISISRTGLAYGVFVSNVFTSLLSHSFWRRLDLETVYECEVVIDGDTATVRSPDGAVLTVTDSRLVTLDGDFAGFECFQEAPADMLPRFHEVWADTRSVKTFDVAPLDAVMRASADAASRAVLASDTNTGAGAFTHRFLDEASAAGNTAFGANAHADLTTADGNTAVGLNAQANVTTGNNNTAVGSNAQVTMTTAANNVAVGAAAQLALTSGTGDVAVGFQAQTALTTGISDTAVGHQAQDAVTTGSQNTAVGAGAQGALTTADNNTAVGSGAQAALTSSATNATAVGTNAQAALTSGANNVAVGVNAQAVATTAANSTAVGTNAQAAMTTGSGANTGIGYNSQLALTSGHSSTAVGSDSLRAVTTGHSNTALGASTARLLTGNSNTILGAFAAYTPNGVVANATTSALRQTAVGVETGLGSTAQDNDVTVVGYRAIGTGTGATAVGSGAQAAFAGSVALGMSTVTTAADQVSVAARHLEMTELAADAAAGAANSGRLYMKDNGAGKTQLCVRFATGAVQVIATEP